MVLDCGKKLDRSEKTNTCMGKNMETPHRKVLVGFKLPSRCEMRVQTNTPPCRPLLTIYSLGIKEKKT